MLGESRKALSQTILTIQHAVYGQGNYSPPLFYNQSRFCIEKFKNNKRSLEIKINLFF